MDKPFATIAEHWAHFLERDMAPEAPEVQVMEMKRAFAAGAISGLQLAVMAVKDCTAKQATVNLLAHIEGIKNLSPSSTGAKR